MWHAFLVPTSKVPIGVASFITYVLPPLLFYFAMAAMAITPQTRALRVASCPVVASLALRAMLSVDMAPVINQVVLTIPMLFIATRAFYWALKSEPFVRQRQRPTVNSTTSTLIDALDLALNLRGHGWDWSHGLYVPHDTRPSHRILFVSHVILSAVVHAFVCGTSYTSLRSFSPAGLGAVVGGSIFDDILPPHIRYLRSSIISIVGALAVYSFLQTGYDVCTLAGVLLGQDPAQWPPAFDAPWRATSLVDLWGRRWHQWLRHTFLVQGGYPLASVFGRTGLVVGAFLSSAMFHHVELYSLDDTSEFWRMLVGFGMMVPGILCERAFKRWTRRKVGGMAGWVWTMGWLALWGNLIMDGFVRVALFRSGVWVAVLPSGWRTWVERLVTELDTWLHAV